MWIEDMHLLGCDTTWIGIQVPVFWSSLLPRCPKQMFVRTYQSTCHHLLQVQNLHQHHFQNVICHIMWISFTWLRIGTYPGSYEYGNEHKKGGEFMYQLNVCQILKDSAARNQCIYLAFMQNFLCFLLLLVGETEVSQLHSFST